MLRWSAVEWYKDRHVGSDDKMFWCDEYHVDRMILVYDVLIRSMICWYDVQWDEFDQCCDEQMIRCVDYDEWYHEKMNHVMMWRIWYCVDSEDEIMVLMHWIWCWIRCSMVLLWWSMMWFRLDDDTIWWLWCSEYLVLWIDVVWCRYEDHDVRQMYYDIDVELIMSIVWNIKSWEDSDAVCVMSDQMEY